MNKEINRFFGNDLSYYQQINQWIIDEVRVKKEAFTYLDINCFMQLPPGKAMQVYWYEILQRVYIANITALLRHSEWTKGIGAAMREKNYNLFCSAVRGFLESECDIYYSLSALPLNIAENNKIILRALAGRLDDRIIAGPEIENQLLHFQEAAKSAAKRDPKHSYLRPETAKTYLEHKHLKQFNLYEIYSELCEITHPARQSLAVYLDDKDYEYRFMFNPVTFIDKFIDRNSERLNILYLAVNNTIVISLLLLNTMCLDFQTTCLNKVDPNTIPLWTKIQQFFVP